MTDTEKTQRLREQATRIRQASLKATNGGHVEDAILRRVADRLDADADLLELRGETADTAQEPLRSPPAA